MSLEQSLQLAVQNIRSGRLTQEAQVKQSVIVPILRALDWIDTNPSEFITEFPVPPDGRVDYALCVGPTQNPLVFIEAKRLGNVDYRAEGQLFGYAVNRGVPFLILTDGNVWDFYLSMAPGEPSQRRFKHLDLQRDDLVADCAPFFEQYLRKSRVLSPEARIDAERLLQTDLQKSTARNAIPRVWQTLLVTQDANLCKLIEDTVETTCGTRPETHEVAAFLRQFLASSTPSSPPPASTPSTPADWDTWTPGRKAAWTRKSRQQTTASANSGDRLGRSKGTAKIGPNTGIQSYSQKRRWTHPKHSQILTLNEAYAIAKTPESEARLAEVNRQVEAGELAKRRGAVQRRKVKRATIQAAGWRRSD